MGENLFSIYVRKNIGKKRHRSEKFCMKSWFMAPGLKMFNFCGIFPRQIEISISVVIKNSFTIREDGGHTVIYTFIQLTTSTNFFIHLAAPFVQIFVLLPKTEASDEHFEFYRHLNLFVCNCNKSFSL